MRTRRNPGTNAGDACAPIRWDGEKIMTDATNTYDIKIDSTVIDFPVVPADGDTPVTYDYAPLIKSYTDADAGTKTKIRNAIKIKMDASVRAMDIVTAKIYMDAGDAIKSVSTKTPEKVDYNRVMADRVHALRIAADLIITGDALPDGIDADMIDIDLITDMVISDNTPPSGAAVATYGDSIMTAARTIAGAKITKSADRSDIGEMILTAVRAVPVNTVLTVAMIQKASGAPSGGAIAARLWPVATKNGQKVSVPTSLDLTAMGIELTTNESGTRAVRKINSNGDVPADNA